MKLSIPTAVKPVIPNLSAAVLPVKTEQEIVAAKLGCVPDEAPLDLNVVRAAMTRGVLVDTRAKRWRGFFTLTAQDCGIPPDSKVKRSNERVCIIPQKILTSILNGESKIRRSVVETGFRVPGGYRGYFVPLTEIPQFKRLYEEGEKEVRTALEQLASHPDKHEEYIRKTVAPPLIPRAWLGHRSTWTEGKYKAGHFSEQAKPTEAFAATFTERLVSSIPPPDFLRESVDIGYTYNLLHLPEVAAAVNIAADNEALNREIRTSLEEQRESLPRRFVAGVHAAIAEVLETVRQRALRGSSPLPGPTTKMFNAAMNSLATARSLNLVGDKRVDAILREAEMGMKKAHTLAVGRQEPLKSSDYLIHIQRACEKMNELTTGYETEDEE